MVKKNAQAVFGDSQFEGITITTEDFTAAPDESESVPSGEIAEILRTEVEEDGQLASYDAVQLGGQMDPTGDSAKGKIFADLRNDSDNEIDQRTQIRFIARPKNGNRRTALTEWMTLRDVNRDDPRTQVPLPPVTDGDGDPQLVSSGRIIAMEVRNGATSVTVDQSNSELSLPATAGY